MKIVKSTKGFKQTFDTNTLSIEEYTGSTTQLEPLHHTSDITDYEYLKKFFPEDHSIFLGFGDSFYYVLNSPEHINQETQNLIFEELAEEYDYWGENNLFEMIDFCNRNNLKSRKRTLTLLLNLKVWH